MDNLKRALLSTLRSKETTHELFRAAADQLAQILAQETSQFIATKTVEIETPTDTSTEGTVLNDDIVLIPILRSGIVLLNAFLDSYPTATVGFVGLRRDEVTAVAELYYENIPPINAKHQVIVLDPMIATGGSGCDALRLLTDRGAAQEQIIFVSIIASTPGLERIRAEYPRVTVTTVGEDTELNANKFIVPGLGDFGDRYFGTQPLI